MTTKKIKTKTKNKRHSNHHNNSLSNQVNIHIHDDKKKRKSKKKKRKPKSEPEGVDSHYPLIIPQQQYYINQNRPFDYGHNNNDSLKAYIDAKFKSIEPTSTTLTHNDVTKKETEPIFFTDEKGDPIESEGSFFANVSVKRRGDKEHFVFSKAKPTLENQVEATGADEVITPVPEAVIKPSEVNSDTFGDNISDESTIPFQEPEIKSTTSLRSPEASITPEPETQPVSPPVIEENKSQPVDKKKVRELRDKLLTLVEEENQLVKEYTKLADDYEKLKKALTTSPDEKITDEEWTEFKRLAHEVNYPMKSLSNKKQNKAKALKKLNELEKVLKAEIERKEAIMKKKIEDSKQRFPPESKSTVQTLKDYGPTALAGGAILAVSQGVDYLYKAKKATDIPPKIIEYVVDGIGAVAGGINNVIGTDNALNLAEMGESTGILPQGTRKAVERMTPNKGRGVHTPIKAGSRKARKKGTPINKN
jgi:hypothetical protein